MWEVIYILHLLNSLPWFAWLLCGVIGPFYIVIWVIRSTKNDPALWRIGWVIGAVLGVIAATDNLIKSTGIEVDLDYWPVVMDRAAMPLVVLMASLIFIGGYQKCRQPGFDPEKRRIATLCMYGIVITFICMGLIFAGFYIYDNFLGR